MADSQWYDVISSDAGLRQGDIIPRCPVLVPVDSGSLSQEEISAESIEYNVIVLSQSCDLVQDKLDLVIVCPLFTLDKYADKNPFFKNPKGQEALNRGYTPGAHLLGPCRVGQFGDNYLVVDFLSTFSIPLPSLKGYAENLEKRVRLLSPYREHLSQAFARFFMRVGLPTGIPPFHKTFEFPPD